MSQGYIKEEHRTKSSKITVWVALFHVPWDGPNWRFSAPCSTSWSEYLAIFATQGISTHFCTQIERIGAGAWSVRSWSWWVKLFPPAATSKSLRYSPRLFHVLASGAVSDPIGKCGKRMKTLFLCLLLDLVSWGFGYPTNLEHATSLSLVLH